MIMGELELSLEYVRETLRGVDNLLDILYKVGERGNNIMIIQGFWGHLKVAEQYLKRNRVFWVYPEYDLRISGPDGEVRVEVKTGKCWNDKQTSLGYANAFGLKLENFENLCFVIVSGEYAVDSRKVFKILNIPKSDLDECKTPHSWSCGNDENEKHPSFVFYGYGECGEYELAEAEKKIAKKEKYEIYEIERKIAKDEKLYTFWERSEEHTV